MRRGRGLRWIALQRLDDPGLALGLGTGHAAVRSHLLQPGKQLVPVDHLGGAELIAVVDPDQVVGLAPADAEELLDGWRGRSPARPCR